MNAMQTDFVKWFRNVAPYVHSHHGTTVVINLGGELLDSDHLQTTVHDIALLSRLGIKPVITFGARLQIEQALASNGLSSNYSQGLRVTDKATMDVIEQVIGGIRIKLEAMLSVSLPNSPMAGSSIQVSSGNYVMAKPAGVVDGVDLQQTGVVRRIDCVAIQQQIEAGYIVLIPPLGYSITGEVFDLSAVELAGELAVHLQTDKLIYLLPESEGLHELKTPGHMIQQQVETLLAQHKEEYQSPYPELRQAVIACDGGIPRVHLINQTDDGGLLVELFSRDGQGLLISKKPFDTLRKANIDDIAGILELINPLIDKGILAKRTREKIESELNDYMVMVRDGTVIACGALHVYPRQHIAELACLVVHEQYQRQDKGEQLFNILIREADDHHLEKIFVLTTQAQHWFIARGFVEGKISELPEDKQRVHDKQRNSKVLIKSLD